MSKDIQPTASLLYETQSIVNDLMEKKGVKRRVVISGAQLQWESRPKKSGSSTVKKSNRR